MLSVLSGRWESDPLPSPWEGDVLPVNYARVKRGSCRARSNDSKLKEKLHAQFRTQYLIVNLTMTVFLGGYFPRGILNVFPLWIMLGFAKLFASAIFTH